MTKDELDDLLDELWNDGMDEANASEQGRYHVSERDDLKARVVAEMERQRLEAEELRRQLEQATNALQRIVTWSDAYPLDVFPKPDLALARELLSAGGITLDAVTANAMRHVVEGVGKIAREALAALDD